MSQKDKDPNTLTRTAVQFLQMIVPFNPLPRKVARLKGSGGGGVEGGGKGQNTYHLAPAAGWWLSTQ